MSLSAARMAAVAACLMMTAAAAGPRPAPLRPVDAGKIDPRWQSNICALREMACGARRDLALYRAVGDPADAYWLIAPEGPAIARLRRTEDGWTSGGVWDFAAYDRVPGGGDRDGPLRIYPALYPVGPDAWAVALTHARTVGYSGGGARFESADFALLGVGVPKVIHTDVPFSCSQIIRACFGEQDHSRSPHCHDETEGWLSLQIQPAPDGGAYRWRATWRERLWPSGKPESAKRTTTSPMGLDGAPAAHFCGGID